MLDLARGRGYSALVARTEVSRLAAMGLALASCGGVPVLGVPAATGVVLSTAPAETTGDEVEDGTSTTGGGGEGTSVAGTTDVVRLDAGIPDAGVPAFGCRGKIDFLFVVSAQVSMKEYQPKLLAAFPAFVAAIEERLPGFDVHMMVVNGVLSGWQMTDCGLCEDPDDCDPEGAPPGCGATLDKCDQIAGGAVTFPAGEGASNRRCELFGGHRYVISGDPDMAGSFACIAQVGLASVITAPADAMFAALDAKLNQPAFCNGGFLRDDALLFVTFLHDTRDFASDGYPPQWATRLLEIKHGDPDALMVVALSNDLDEPGAVCTWDGPMGEWSNELRRLTQKVAHGRFGSICMPEYAPFFAAALDEARALCEDPIPR